MGLIGLNTTKRLEKIKSDVLKEKEWQIKWSELFFSQAIKLNDHVSKLVCKLYYLQTESGAKKKSEINIEIYLSVYAISEVGWNIKNYTQFSPEYGKDVEEIQSRLIEQLHKILSDKKGDLELIRPLQFEYNKAIKKAHAEMLMSKN